MVGGLQTIGQRDGDLILTSSWSGSLSLVAKTKNIKECRRKKTHREKESPESAKKRQDDMRMKKLDLVQGRRGGDQEK